MLMKRTATTRVIATLITTLALLAAVPQAAHAETENLWKYWASDFENRSPWEMPFAILFSLPAMIVTTPFWLGNAALDKLKGDD
jgi:hypothetical protein